MKVNYPAVLYLALVIPAVSSASAEEMCFSPEVLETTAPLQKISEELEAKTLLACTKELFNHKSIPKESRGNYWHKINGKENFAKQCWSLDNYGEKNIIYSFLSEDGLKVLKFPVYYYKEGTIKTSLPRNIMRFQADGKNLLISQFDNVGEYFDSLEEAKLTSFVKEKGIMGNPVNIKKKYIDGYEQYLAKNNQKTPSLKKPSDENVSHEDALSCIKDRLADYVSIIWLKERPEALPYINTLNKDIGRTDRTADDIKTRYKNSPEEIVAEMKKSIFPDGSPCRGVISDQKLNDIFEKDFGSRKEHYNNVRKYFQQFNK